MSRSDSGEDLGGFTPTTPHPQPKRTTKSQKNSKLNGRITSEAGPSSKPTKASRNIAARKTVTRARNRASPTDDDNSDVQEDEDIQMVDVAKSKKGTTDLAALSPSSNGKSAAKGKGRGKVPGGRSKKTSPGGDTIDVDAAQGYEELDDDIADVAQRAILAHGGGTRKDRDSTEMARLRERLRLTQVQLQSSMEKLEESLRIRETEPEKMLKAMEEQYKAELASKEALVEALTSQIAQKETLAQRGKHSILHLITREAADEEQRKLVQDVAQLRGALAEKDQALHEKDNQIAGLRQIENELRFELKAEIERSKALADKSIRTPQVAPRSRMAGAAFEDPKNAEVIRFYEDLTNLLVTSMKHQASHRPGADEWILKCIYTYSEDDMATDALQKIKTMLNSDPNEQSIHYTPDDLDKEPPDFVDKLGFLNQPFTFSRQQLSLFLRTLNDNIKEALASEDEDEDEVQIIE
ncbi:hypothetical protein F5887DRAFT_1208823 [Amanita rubescens]|nr:hypothetical protein F5887DRAFT_1208823 [Amanita rubescens]